MMNKVVINRCYGGFALSEIAQAMYMERTKNTPKPQDWHIDTHVSRDDPDLIAVIEHLGHKPSSGNFSNLKIIAIPSDVSWEVKDHDGVEWIAEKHRTWSGSDNESNED